MYIYPLKFVVLFRYLIGLLILDILMSYEVLLLVGFEWVEDSSIPAYSEPLAEH